MPMDAKELVKDGRLSAAIEAATREVRNAPGNLTARITIFELLAAAGEWQRAEKHLDVVADQAPDMLEGVASYQGVLHAEDARSRLFDRDEGDPGRVTLLPVEAEPQRSAIHLLHAGDAEGAGRLLDEAEAARPRRRGTVDGATFDDLRDADDVLAGVLEVISNGHYGWIPFARIRQIDLAPARFLRDTLWLPATITLVDGVSSSTMFVPVRYPGSERHSDDRVRLARATEWTEAPGPVRGVGQRAFLAGDELRYVLETRNITFEG
jgi:type VI secretion system protein ImpE